MKGGATALDMDTLGHFLYMDSIERKQKDDAPDIFDEANSSEDDENE